ncbi:uncharacterized protein LOC125034631 [Penaeus chinensis]|uniref:uncharacterized protein LOC125034631 n=1 Tax=Penaeus chinensis TaxID=139456 RepID=UPI001FB69DAA|nr:uncharacterized protein LOC125034631 [Penaeus chinensis]
MDGPWILKSEKKAAVGKVKKNKAAGPDEIVTEMVTAMEDFGIEKLTNVINDIYGSGEIPKELSKSIFIALPKKPGAIEYSKKAFDKVQHEELLKALQSLDLDGKDIRLIRNLYWEQTAFMRGFAIGGHNMNNLRYADDTVLISESAEKLQELLEKFHLTRNAVSVDCSVWLNFRQNRYKK